MAATLKCLMIRYSMLERQEKVSFMNNVVLSEAHLGTPVRPKGRGKAFSEGTLMHTYVPPQG